MMYLGDFPEDETLHFLWSSNDSNGASITRATDGTVSVYKDNGVTQSVAGVTDTEDFDSLTGIHACTIDLSADAFYAIGANYTVVLSASTIDGQTVNAVLAHFSIENRTTLPKADANNLTAAQVNAECDTALSDYDGPTDAEMIARTLVAASYFDPTADAVANVTLCATTTTNTDMVTEPPTAAANADAVWDEVIVAAHDIANSAGALLDTPADWATATGFATSAALATAQSDLDILTGADGVTLATAQALYAPALASVCTEARLAELDAGNLPTDVAAIPTTAMRGTDSGALASVCTEARLSELDAATGGKMANQVDVIETDTTSLNDTKIPDTISLAAINAEVDTALTTTTYAEPAQGTPGATISIEEKISYIYKFLRNRVTSTSTTISVFNDDAATVDHKSTHSDDATTYDRGEFTTGP